MNTSIINLKRGVSILALPALFLAGGNGAHAALAASSCATETVLTSFSTADAGFDPGISVDTGGGIYLANSDGAAKAVNGSAR
jgi:hypothetical protein